MSSASPTPGMSETRDPTPPGTSPATLLGSVPNDSSCAAPAAVPTPPPPPSATLSPSGVAVTSLPGVTAAALIMSAMPLNPPLAPPKTGIEEGAVRSSRILPASSLAFSGSTSLPSAAFLTVASFWFASFVFWVLAAISASLSAAACCPKEVARLAAVCSPAAALAWVPARPAMSRKAPAFWTAPRAPASPAGAGASGAFWRLMMVCGNGVGAVAIGSVRLDISSEGSISPSSGSVSDSTQSRSP